jgi:hypothetical protein
MCRGADRVPEIRKEEENAETAQMETGCAYAHGMLYLLVCIVRKASSVYRTLFPHISLSMYRTIATDPWILLSSMPSAIGSACISI